jgi:hypothetical protein
MAKSQPWQGIPTRLSAEEFKQFVLPHLSTGSRGPAPKLSLHAIFNYILRLPVLRCGKTNCLNSSALNLVGIRCHGWFFAISTAKATGF